MNKILSFIKGLLKKKAVPQIKPHVHEWKFEYGTGDALSVDKRAAVYSCKGCGKFGLMEWGKGSKEITELK